MVFVKEWQQRTAETCSREEELRAENSCPHKSMLKKNVLRRQKDFDSIYKRGKSTGDKYVVVFFKRNNLSYSRLAYLASKKVGNSVQRNRARRLMKESMRLSDMELPAGYDFVIIARKTIGIAKCQDVQRSLESAFRRTGVFK